MAYDRNDSDRYDRDRYGDPRERGFFDRAGDEVRSWFGDEEAERRRRYDERIDTGGYRERNDRYSAYPRSNRDDGYRRGGYSGDRAYAPSYDPPEEARQFNDPRRDHRRGGYGDGTGDPLGVGRHAAYQDRERSRERDDHGHEEGYRSWRNAQIESFDRDYDEYRRENQSRFQSEFATWRQNRQTQRTSLGQVKEHQEVVGSDGAHVGTVDHVRSDHILLTKNDPDAGGHHHSIPSSWIATVTDKVQLSKTAEEAKRSWTDAENRGGLFGGDRDGDAGGRGKLNRSFSGTY